MSNISLQNINNYNDNFDSNINEIFSKYVLIINEYLQQIIDVIYTKDDLYLKYITCKGIETITHVFKILLLYTKNLEISYYYTQKAFYYYTEFIGQIIQIDEEHQSYLQLNCKDASLFVYKKTIFEINNDIKKNLVSESNNSNIIDRINIILYLYSNCIKSIINNIDLKSNIKENFLNVKSKMNKIIIYILELYDVIDNNKIYYYDLIYYFYNNIKLNDYDKIDYLEHFIKKLLKNQISLKKLKSNLNDENIYSNINNSTKYINMLFIN